MTRKKYYKLLEEYNSLVSSKNYNSMYLDDKKFESIKNQLKKKLSTDIHKFTLELQLIYKKGYDRFIIEKYENLRYNTEKVYNKIIDEKHINKEDYYSTFSVSYPNMFSTILSLLLLSLLSSLLMLF